MVDIFKLFSLHTWRSLGLNDPVLAAWCSWDSRVEGEDGRHGAAMAGELIGHLMGAGIAGSVIGSLAGSRIAGEPDTDGRLYSAKLGVVILTDQSLALVDCGHTVKISEHGVREKHAERFMREAKGERKFKVWIFGLSNISASLRKDGSVLQLSIPGSDPWRLQIAKIADDPDARAFVRVIQFLPEVPTAEEFVTLALSKVPSPSVLDAMAMDGSVDAVLRHIAELDRERLARLLGNVSQCRSSAFAVRIEEWLAQRALPASKGKLDVRVAIALGVASLGYAIFKPASHPAGMRWVGIGAAVILLAVAKVWEVWADDAQWFAGQLARFREARANVT